MSEFKVNYSDNSIDCMLDRLNQPNKRIYERLSEELSSIERKINNKEEFERIISIIEKYVSKKLHEIENDSKNSFTINIEKDIKDIKNSNNIKNNDIIEHIGNFIVLIFIYNKYEAHANSPRYPYFTIIK